jgi:hypothetical protein
MLSLSIAEAASVTRQCSRGRQRLDKLARTGKAGIGVHPAPSPALTSSATACRNAISCGE